MNGAPKQNLTRTCGDCPLWPAGTQGGCPTQEKIQLCINHVLGGRRQWITGEEFLAQVAAHRQKRLQESLKATKPFQPGPFVRTYILDWSLQYKPKRPVLSIPEDLL
jgi:hypothetical protein